MKNRKKGLQKQSLKSPRLTPEQSMEFVENFKKVVLASDQKGSTLISLRVPKSLLAAFKMKCLSENKPYQTEIKKLMAQYLETVGSRRQS